MLADVEVAVLTVVAALSGLGWYMYSSMPSRLCLAHRNPLCTVPQIVQFVLERMSELEGLVS